MATRAELLIKGGQIVTAAHGEYPARGKAMQKLEVLHGGWVACAGERIIAVGTPAEVQQ